MRSAPPLPRESRPPLTPRRKLGGLAVAGICRSGVREGGKKKKEKKINGGKRRENSR
jgi:hypothetical protein